MNRSTNVPLTLDQIRLLHACLNAIVAWFDVFSAGQPGQYIDFSTLLTSQLRHCIGMLFYLTTLDDPGWDKASVRSRLDVLKVVDSARSNLWTSAEAAGWQSDDGCNAFHRVHDLMGHLRDIWAAKLAQMDAADADALFNFDPNLLQNVDADWFGMNWVTGAM